MRLFRVLVAIGLIAVAPLPVLAAPQDAVMNREGYWGIDVDNGACAASMTLQGGAVFLLRAHEGQVTFGLFARTPLPRGKAGRIETEAYGFDFKPSYGEEAKTLYYADNFDARALAALRLAKQARILVDGRMVTAMTLEGTGFEGALDGVIACSNGQSGWWGKGVGAPAAAAPAGPALVYHPDGVWTIIVSDAVCIATAAAPDARYLQLLSVAGNTGIAVGSNAGPLPRGDSIHVQTDGYMFDFKPDYDKDAKYLSSADPLESADLFALRRAKRVRMSAGRRELLDVELAGGTFFDVVENVAACSRGEKGWWGEGAKPAS